MSSTEQISPEQIEALRLRLECLLARNISHLQALRGFLRGPWRTRPVEAKCLGLKAALDILNSQYPINI